jgi:hypothetical protein
MNFPALPVPTKKNARESRAVLSFQLHQPNTIAARPRQVVVIRVVVSIA